MLDFAGHSLRKETARMTRGNKTVDEFADHLKSSRRKAEALVVRQSTSPSQNPDSPLVLNPVRSPSSRAEDTLT